MMRSQGTINISFNSKFYIYIINNVIPLHFRCFMTVRWCPLTWAHPIDLVRDILSHWLLGEPFIPAEVESSRAATHWVSFWNPNIQILKIRINKQIKLKPHRGRQYKCQSWLHVRHIVLLSYHTLDTIGARFCSLQSEPTPICRT